MGREGGPEVGVKSVEVGRSWPSLRLPMGANELVELSLLLLFWTCARLETAPSARAERRKLELAARLSSGRVSAFRGLCIAR